MINARGGALTAGFTWEAARSVALNETVRQSGRLQIGTQPVRLAPLGHGTDLDAEENPARTKIRTLDKRLTVAELACEARLEIGERGKGLFLRPARGKLNHVSALRSRRGLNRRNGRRARGCNRLCRDGDRRCRRRLLARNWRCCTGGRLRHKIDRSTLRCRSVVIGSEPFDGNTADFKRCICRVARPSRRRRAGLRR